jgi:phage-related protein
LGVSATARAVKIVYDGLADRVKSVTLGSVRANIADTIANQQKEIQQTPTKSDLKRAQEAATAWLTNGQGYAYFRKDDLGNIKDILFMDTQDPQTAVNVMRVGQSGIGFSHNGVNGLYESAWTIDGKFNADFILAGVIKGMAIESGVIQSADGKLVINLDTGVFSVNSENGTKLFDVATKVFDVDGKERAELSLYDVEGNQIVRIVEDITRTGAGVEVSSNDGKLKARFQATNNSAGVNLMLGGKSVAQLGVTASGYTVVSAGQVSCDQIIGKEISWKSNGDGTYTLIGK